LDFRRCAAIGVIGALGLLGACTGVIGPGAGSGGDDDGSGDPDGGLPSRPDGAPPPTMGTIALFLEADRGAGQDVVVSLGVPFPPGALVDPSQVAVFDPSGTEVAAAATSLATWPGDGSQRAVLVAFRATLAAGAKATWSLHYGVDRSAQAGVLTPNPDGPVAAWLDPAWYASSHATGPGLAASQNSKFMAWEVEIEQSLTQMSPAWTTYGLSCATTSAERSYYDGPHALYQRFTHRGGAAAYRRARDEALWYRENELDWYDGGKVALYKCESSWDPADPMDWGSLRRMLGQGMLDDYLLTGDPAARAAVAGLGEAFRQNLPALTAGREIIVYVTERNMAWPMMGLAAYYAIDHRAEVRAALDKLVDMTVAWQAKGTSGAFEHDINRPDPDECGDGPAGGSPFMTSLLIDGLMDSYALTGDSRIPSVVVKAATWYRDSARSSDGTAFMYLWGCKDVDYDNGDTADLNLLISHVFGAAYDVSGDAGWLDFGDVMAGHGVDNMYAGAPKQWSQSARTFIRYLGYRAQGRAP
jgi:hypothetical protein